MKIKLKYSLSILILSVTGILATCKYFDQGNPLDAFDLIKREESVEFNIKLRDHFNYRIELVLKDINKDLDSLDYQDLTIVQEYEESKQIAESKREFRLEQEIKRLERLKLSEDKKKKDLEISKLKEEKLKEIESQRFAKLEESKRIKLEKSKLQQEIKVTVTEPEKEKSSCFFLGCLFANLGSYDDGKHYYGSNRADPQVVQMVKKRSKEVRIPFKTVAYHIQNESGWNCKVRNTEKAVNTATGLLQPVWRSHAAIVGNPYMTKEEHLRKAKDCDHNIKVGLAHMKACIDAKPHASDHQLWKGCHMAGHGNFGTSIHKAAEVYRKTWGGGWLG